MAFLRFHHTTHRLLWMATSTPEDEDRQTKHYFNRPWETRHSNMKGKAIILIDKINNSIQEKQ